MMTMLQKENMDNTVLNIENVHKKFTPKIGPVSRALNTIRGITPQAVHAVSDVSLTVKKGEIVGLVGESGCGKSTLGRMAAHLLSPSAGQITVNGIPLQNATPRIHSDVQMVFQNPYSSLNPRQRIRESIAQGAVHHGLMQAADIDEKVAQLLEIVGLDRSYINRFPHQFSGGQRQRIAIARALAMNPSLIICDEAVSALDVSIQAQILNLFLDLRENHHLTYLFISHNLSVVEYLADRVAIMYLGRIVEIAPSGELFSNPNHPYTAALIADAPRMEAAKADHKPIQGELPSPLNPPSGCAFHPRCPHARARCKTERPELKTIAVHRMSACHLNDSL